MKKWKCLAFLFGMLCVFFIGPLFTNSWVRAYRWHEWKQQAEADGSTEDGSIYADNCSAMATTFYPIYWSSCAMDYLIKLRVTTEAAAREDNDATN